MKKIVAYLLMIAATDVVLLGADRIGVMPVWWASFGLIVPSALIAGIGGVIYCFRGVYLNACVRKTWDDEWRPWYYIRPIVSHLCGAVSFLFLKAGLLVLDAQQKAEGIDLGFLAIAFIAGLNVDKFLAKIEDISQATWGIEKSRSAKEGDKDENKDI